MTDTMTPEEMARKWANKEIIDTSNIWNGLYFGYLAGYLAGRKAGLEDFSKVLLKVLRKAKKTADSQPPLEVYIHMDNIIGNIYPYTLVACRELLEEELKS